MRKALLLLLNIFALSSSLLSQKISISKYNESSFRYKSKYFYNCFVFMSSEKYYLTEPQTGNTYLFNESMHLIDSAERFYTHKKESFINYFRYLGLHSKKSLKQTSFITPVALISLQGNIIVKNYWSGFYLYTKQLRFKKAIIFKSKTKLLKSSPNTICATNNGLFFEINDRKKMVYIYNNKGWLSSQKLFQLILIKNIEKTRKLKENKSNQIVNYDTFLLKDPRILNDLNYLGYTLDSKNDYIYMNYESSPTIYVYDLTGNLKIKFGGKGHYSNSDSLYYIKDPGAIFKKLSTDSLLKISGRNSAAMKMNYVKNVHYRDIYVDTTTGYVYRTYLSAVPDSIIKKQNITADFNWQDLEKYQQLYLQVYNQNHELVYDTATNEEYFKILDITNGEMIVSLGHKLWVDEKKYYNTIAKYKITY